MSSARGATEGWPSFSGVRGACEIVEDAMNKLIGTLALSAILLTSPAFATHVTELNTPFASRGACEAERASLSNDDDFLLDAFPNLFSSAGEVRSFLNRAFLCEQSRGDDQWYITDHRREVLASEWFKRRL